MTDCEKQTSFHPLIFVVCMHQIFLSDQTTPSCSLSKNKQACENRRILFIVKPPFFRNSVTWCLKYFLLIEHGWPLQLKEQVLFTFFFLQHWHISSTFWAKLGLTEHAGWFKAFHWLYTVWSEATYRGQTCMKQQRNTLNNAGIQEMDTQAEIAFMCSAL